jgi:hypothetical protein
MIANKNEPMASEPKLYLKAQYRPLRSVNLGPESLLHVKYHVQTATMIAKSKTAQMNSLIQKRAKTDTPSCHFRSSLPSKLIVFN